VDRHKADFLKAAADLQAWRKGREGAGPKSAPVPADIAARLRQSALAYHAALCPTPDPAGYADRKAAELEQFQADFIQRLGGYDPTGEENLRDDFRARLKQTIRDWMKHRGGEWRAAVDQAVARAVGLATAGDGPDTIPLDDEPTRTAREALAKAVKDIEFAVEAYKSDAEIVLRPREAFEAAVDAVKTWRGTIDPKQPGQLPGELRRRLEDAVKNYHFALAPKPTAEAQAAAWDRSLHDLRVELRSRAGDVRDFFDPDAAKGKLMARADGCVEAVRRSQRGVQAAFDAALAAAVESALKGRPVEVDPEACRDARKARKRALDDAAGALEDLRQAARTKAAGDSTPRDDD
jgi:hypothetical protein